MKFLTGFKSLLPHQNLKAYVYLKQANINLLSFT